MSLPSSTSHSKGSRPRAEQHLVDKRVFDAKTRPMNETAHDLRAPLTSVQESIRSVRGGDFGEVSQNQEVFLDTAIDQCDCMEQMIGEMVHLERLRTGIPRANREWRQVQEIRSIIEEAIQPWAVSRQVDVLWDVQVDPSAKVFADVAMIRRLVVNLVTNAMRVTPESGGVLVRLQSIRGGDLIRWTVIDRGIGIKEQELRQIAQHQDFCGGSEEMGLAICRQLAAIHFSSLEIRSRHRFGTEVSFEIASAGPRSVANAWSRWRLRQRGPMQSPHRRDPPVIQSVQEVQTPILRVDPPVIKIELMHEATSPRCENRIAAGVVSLGVTVSREAADHFDQLLQGQMQMFDFAYRVATRRWVWAFDIDANGVECRIKSIADTVLSRIPEMRMNWTNPQMIPIDGRRMHARLTDLLIRETLSASTSLHPSDKNAVRLGTAPIAVSNVATSRLDQELRRLTRKLRSQTQVLREQAQALRPQ